MKATTLPQNFICENESNDLITWQEAEMNSKEWQEMEFEFDLDLSLWSLTKSLFSFFIFWK